MNNSNSNVWFLLGAAVVGLISAASVFIVERIRQDKRRHVFTQQLARVDGKLSTMQKELEMLRQLQNERTNNSAQQKSNRRRLRSSSTLSTTSTNEYGSAVENDSSDLEFYDLSSDEDNDINTVIIKALCDIDSKLEDESASSAKYALSRLNELVEEYPTNVDLIWRRGKAYKIMANHEKDNEKRSNLVNKGVEACELAVQLKPKMAICHKWLGILIGMRSEFLPIKEKILEARLCKEHIDIAVTLTPEDPLLHHMLGRYAFEIAQLSWIERSLAQALFAELPATSHQEALDHFMEAEKLSMSDWKANRLFIAKCSLAIGQTELAIAWLNKAKNASSVEEERVHEEVNTLLKKYQ